jgi:membrane protease subunit (stomatin/prohibitin family)
LKGWKYGFNSPFKAEVYFLNTKNFTDQKWGTPNPIMLRDPEFGPIRIRAFGNYAMKVKDPVKFIKEIVGTDGSFTTDKITEQLKNVVVTRFTDAIGECKIPVLDMASNYDELSKFLEDKIKPEFMEYGIDLTKFLISNISLPPNVEEALDKRSSMGILGDLNKYTQFQAAESMTAAANNPSGTAGAGMGMGMGFAMANQMANAMNPQNQQQQNQQTPPPVPPTLQFFAVVNGQQSGPYDMNTLKQMISQNQLSKETLVWRQGMANWDAAGKVTELQSLFGAVPPPIPPQV